MTAQLLAIDPGSVSGALAAFFSDAKPYVGDLPGVDGQLSPNALYRLVRDMRPRCAVVERVASMPKQGVSSTFKFGMATGIIHGVLAACDVPVHLVTPSVWKRGMGLIGADKEASRALALRLFPQVTGLDRKMDHGRAEALLMGHWFMLSRSMGELPS